MFSRQHYQFIAEAIDLERRTSVNNDQLEEFTNILADKFKRDNPQFLRNRFIAACGFTEDILISEVK